VEGEEGVSEEGIPCKDLWDKMFRLYSDAGISIFLSLTSSSRKNIKRAIDRLELLVELIKYGTDKGCMKDTEDVIAQINALISQLRSKL
jgi:hypothetical protein